MATDDTEKTVDKAQERDIEGGVDFGSGVEVGRGDLLQREHTDPVLDAKMHLVNNAIDEIGFTAYHWKLFVLNGFGYAVDSLILLIQSIIAGKAALEFHPGYKNGLTIAVYVGMLTGAIFWGELTEAYSVSCFEEARGNWYRGCRGLTLGSRPHG